MGVAKQLLAANRRYAETFGKLGKLPGAPARKFAVLTCMDARLDPAKFAGLAEGDAHVIRNAGGRASDDALRSLLLSHALFGVNQWFVIHHTDCAMQHLDTNALTRRFGAKQPQWLPTKPGVASLLEDVAHLQNHPLVGDAVTVRGYLYDCASGVLREITEADTDAAKTDAAE